MVRRLFYLMLVVAVVFTVWTLSVVGALAEAWPKVLPTPTAEYRSPDLAVDNDAVPHGPPGGTRDVPTL